VRNMKMYRIHMQVLSSRVYLTLNQLVAIILFVLHQ
jgi:hypothetical protein